MNDYEKLVCIVGTYNELTRIKELNLQKFGLTLPQISLYDQLQSISDTRLCPFETKLIVRNLLYTRSESMQNKISELICTVFNDKTGEAMYVLSDKMCYDE